MKLKTPDDEEPELSMSPLIDMTFLLLIYFICTCSLIMPEADLGLRLPGMVSQPSQVDMPDEQMIEIKKGGDVFLNDKRYDSASSQELPELVSLLRRYKAASEASKNKALVTIMADGEVPHQRVIDVMNACAAAKIKDISFAGGN